MEAGTRVKCSAGELEKQGTFFQQPPGTDLRRSPDEYFSCGTADHSYTRQRASYARAPLSQFPGHFKLPDQNVTHDSTQRRRHPSAPRNRPQSNTAPGSVFLPGAISLCPVMCSADNVAYPANKARTTPINDPY